MLIGQQKRRIKKRKYSLSVASQEDGNTPMVIRDNSDNIAPAELPACAAVILAAGKSTRMRSATPKSLHPVCGLPVTAHVIRACRAASVERVIIVVGHECEKVMAGLGDDVEYVKQAMQRGTGDAVMAASPALTGWQGVVLVLAGDIPLLQADSLLQLRNLQSVSKAPLAMLTAISENATGYGRILRGSDGTVQGIVEERDASAEQRMIKEWNPSVYLFEAHALWKGLDSISPNNVQGEFYLTDTIDVLARLGARVEATPVLDAREMLGVNTRVELATAAAVMRDRINCRHMLSGVSLVDPDQTYIDVDVEIGTDTLIYPGTNLHGSTSIGTECTIGPSTLIQDSVIGDGCTIVLSQVKGSVLGNHIKVGPFANLRPECDIRDNVKIGDFVEIKKSVLHTGSQVSHLAYIGDAEVGRNTNIGAGAITCNFNGFTKSKTIIGNDAFVGSQSILVAPVTVGDGAIVAAGSVITRDVDNNALAISRSPQENKEEGASRYRASKRGTKT